LTTCVNRWVATCASASATSDFARRSGFVEALHTLAGASDIGWDAGRPGAHSTPVDCQDSLGRPAGKHRRRGSVALAALVWTIELATDGYGRVHFRSVTGRSSRQHRDDRCWRSPTGPCCCISTSGSPLDAAEWWPAAAECPLTAPLFDAMFVDNRATSPLAGFGDSQPRFDELGRPPHRFGRSRVKRVIRVDGESWRPCWAMEDNALNIRRFVSASARSRVRAASVRQRADCLILASDRRGVIGFNVNHAAR
jgi:hypothetical protein